MISHFIQEPFEGTFHIEDADLQKMAKVLNDVNIKKCPYFDLSDKYGNSARYYRENQWIPCSETMPEEAGAYLCTCKDAGRLIITLIKWQPRMKSWNLTGTRTYLKVIAWMPLPEPWKGEEE